MATSSGRPRAKDLDDHTKECTMLAIKLYRCYLTADYMFPVSVGEGEFAKRAWDDACEEFNERLPLTPYVAKLVRALSPLTRSFPHTYRLDYQSGPSYARRAQD